MAGNWRQESLDIARKCGDLASWNKGSAAFASVAFVEGGPDLLAALHFIHCEDRETDCSAVAMLGAGFTIHPEALPFFTQKRIRIFGHNDNGKDRNTGRNAVERWAEQLTNAAATVDAFNFAGLRKVDGSPVKDLNDCTSIHADDFETHRELWTLLP